MIRKTYRAVGGPAYVHACTYVYHPPYDPPNGIYRNLQFYSVDWWGGGGRGDPIDHGICDVVRRIVYNEPGEPYIWYYIWKGYLYSRNRDFYPLFWAYPHDTFAYHGDHLHVTFMKPGGIYP